MYSWPTFFWQHMILDETATDHIQDGADKSLARPTYQCCRTESIVSERGVCSCAKLQVFSCHRGWKEACQAETIDQIHELILEDCQISAEQLGISCERVGSIIHEDLDMKKLSARWVPKCPNADQKRQCQSSEQLLEFFWHDPNDFLSRLVTMDETRLYHYDLGTKQQSV